MKPEPAANPAGSAKVVRFISTVLLFLMMACAVMTVGNLIQNVLPHWHAGIIAGAMLFMVMERLYTHRHFKSLSLFSSEWFVSVGAQWIVVIIFTRLLISYADGLDSFVRDLAMFARGDRYSFFTPEFIVTIVFLILAWWVPARFIDLLDEMGLDEQIARSEAPAYIDSNAIPAHQRLVSLIFSVGIVLAVAAALTRLDLRASFSNFTGWPRLELNHLSGVEAGALLYFAFGLALLSLGRLMTLQTRWNIQRIPVSAAHLARQWGVYSLVFLLGLAVIVSILPAGDSLGFFSILGTLLSFLFGVLAFLGQLIAALLVLLITLPFRLFGRDLPPVRNLPDPSLLTNLPAAPAEPAAASEIWLLIRSIILWGGLAVIIVFSVIRFVRQHENILAALRESRVAIWLRQVWQWLSRTAGKTGESLSRALAEGWQRIAARLEGNRFLSRPGFLSLRSLDPRRQVLFFYLAMIRRGQEQGVARQPSQTPSEYAAALEKALPSADEDIDSITEAFVQARYSRREVDAGAADLVKATWGRIRRALQGKSTREL